METVLLRKIRRTGGGEVLLDEIFMIAIMYLWWLLIGWSERNLAKAVSDISNSKECFSPACSEVVIVVSRPFFCLIDTTLYGLLSCLVLVSRGVKRLLFDCTLIII